MTSIALYTALTVLACHGQKCAPAPCPAPEPVCVVVAPCPAPEPVCEPVACAPKKCHMPKFKMPKLSLFKCKKKVECAPAPEPCEVTYVEAPVHHAPVHATPQASPQATPQAAPQMMVPPAPKKAARFFSPGSIIVYRAN